MLIQIINKPTPGTFICSKNQWSTLNHYLSYIVQLLDSHTRQSYLGEKKNHYHYLFSIGRILLNTASSLMSITELHNSRNPTLPFEFVFYSRWIWLQIKEDWNYLFTCFCSLFDIMEWCVTQWGRLEFVPICFWDLRNTNLKNALLTKWIHILMHSTYLTLTTDFQ